MEELDRLAVEHGLEIRQMMELAGWYIIPLFRALRISPKSKITVVCGKGNKGGDGLSAARHLMNHGLEVSVVLVSKNISKDSKHHLRLLRRMRTRILLFSQQKVAVRNAIRSSDILIDSLIGYHLQGSPRGLFQELIVLMNGAGKKIISYDLPSGIDATTGECLAFCVYANATLSLALPKRAFRNKGTRKMCGRVFLADIGIPRFLYDKIASGSRPHFERYRNSLIPL